MTSFPARLPPGAGTSFHLAPLSAGARTDRTKSLAKFISFLIVKDRTELTNGLRSFWQLFDLYCSRNQPMEVPDLRPGWLRSPGAPVFLDSCSGWAPGAKSHRPRAGLFEKSS
jgi:hypothetical protein